MNGFENEKQIIEEINTKAFNSLSDGLKDSILKINNRKEPKLISAKNMGGGVKPDLCLKIDEKLFYVSVKNSGGGHAFHQEKLETFIPFITTELGASKEIVNAIKLITWSDRTLDGKGEIKDRLYIKEMASLFPNEFKLVQDFLYKNRMRLILRFIAQAENKKLTSSSSYS